MIYCLDLFFEELHHSVSERKKSMKIKEKLLSKIYSNSPSIERNFIECLKDECIQTSVVHFGIEFKEFKNLIMSSSLLL